MPRHVHLELTPTRPIALRWLIALNVAVFFAWQLAATLGDGALEVMEGNFLTSTRHVLHGRVWTLLTSEVSHTALPHLFFNLFALWLFGQDVERVVGSRGFVHLYVAGAIAASIGHVLYGFATGSDVPALGASGAVMSVAVVSAFLFPRRLMLLFFVIPLPQFVAVGLFVLVDLVGMVAPGEDLVAHAAHLGGAAYGWAYWRVHLRHYVALRLRELMPRRPGPWTHPSAP